MIYENYFQVPDDELCRPYGYSDSMMNKAYWPQTVVSGRSCDFLGKWETKEKTITITEREFNDAVRACKVSTYPTIFINLLKKELFK